MRELRNLESLFKTGDIVKVSWWKNSKSPVGGTLVHTEGVLQGFEYSHGMSMLRIFPKYENKSFLIFCDDLFRMKHLG